MSLSLLSTGSNVPFVTVASSAHTVKGLTVLVDTGCGALGMLTAAGAVAAGTSSRFVHSMLMAGRQRGSWRPITQPMSPTPRSINPALRPPTGSSENLTSSSVLPTPLPVRGRRTAAPTMHNTARAAAAPRSHARSGSPC
eukprot:CAMPEP_0172004054 /NCGR_PEP_ID=MMETSP1041-20130122/4259_1 /TAXON_ID=464988 /ORGANISM="Hemiselmis andersenii, Strain CCMP439" /LENGTH=139 /DNA_ID=CAMNT_0012657857 /DNA_START=173 /DNA_END=592 /DNA_ORIENTATION=+